jgi:HK97 family phage major capsid protein
MSRILELREKRAKAWEAAKAFLDSKRGADDRLSPEDAAAYDRMEADVVELGKEVERLERAREIDREIADTVSQPITHVPGTSIKAGRASAAYTAAFWNALRGREYPRNALQVGTDSEGGYLVPDEFEHRLVEALEDQNIIRQLATVIQTSSGERKIPLVSTKGTAAWVEEEALIPESDDAFGQVSLGAYKVATMIKVSNELMNDSVFPLESYIAKEFARRVGAKEEEAFLTGDGSGKPTGVLATTGGAPVGKTTASATAVTFDDVIDLFYALRSPYRPKAVFVTHGSTVKTLRKLKDVDNQYIWQPSIREGTPDTILGRPVYTSAYMPVMAAGAKALVFGDFAYYWIGDRESRTFQRLNELFATTGQVGFIASQRVDGKLILPEAIQVLKLAAS